MSQIYKNSIFWVDVHKVSPNPFQPRREFNESKLKDLSDSIRQYGILQPLVVMRKEKQKEDGGLIVSYELIAGERRLRASKLAGISQVPVIIREVGENDDQLKLELAIIENIQREDLNAVDRAKAFKMLVDKFGFKHAHVALKVGKSREYVSNSIRLLALPEDILDALSAGKITEGHARPLLMLVDRPEEQVTLYKEIIYKKLTVREAERIARHTARDRVRKRSLDLDPDLLALEDRLTTGLGTRVQIERRHQGGRITIDFLSPEDLSKILDRLEDEKVHGSEPFVESLRRAEMQREEAFRSEPEVSEVPSQGYDDVPVTHHEHHYTQDGHQDDVVTSSPQHEEVKEEDTSVQDPYRETSQPETVQPQTETENSFTLSQNEEHQPETIPPSIETEKAEETHHGDTQHHNEEGQQHVEGDYSSLGDGEPDKSSGLSSVPAPERDGARDSSKQPQQTYHDTAPNIIHPQSEILEETSKEEHQTEAGLNPRTASPSSGGDKIPQSEKDEDLYSVKNFSL